MSAAGLLATSSPKLDQPVVVAHITVVQPSAVPRSGSDVGSALLPHLECQAIRVTGTRYVRLDLRAVKVL
jgi:hypothetical protein